MDTAEQESFKYMKAYESRKAAYIKKKQRHTERSRIPYPAYKVPVNPLSQAEAKFVTREWFFPHIFIISIQAERFYL